MENEFSKSWKEYKIILWGLYTSFPVVFGTLMGFTLLHISPKITLAIGLLYLFYWWQRMNRWRCPRCHSPDHGLFGSPVWVKKCKSCGLEKYSSSVGTENTFPHT